MTYGPTGGTLLDPPQAPAGFDLMDRSVRLGRGGQCFDDAAAAVFDWQVQRRAGVRVATDGPATVGRRATLRVGVGPLALTAPVVVVAVVGASGTDHSSSAGERRCGFAYGTLAGHHESGEEAFLVVVDEHDVVWLRIVAFSRLATWYARWGQPVARAVQGLITRRYLRSLGGGR